MNTRFRPTWSFPPQLLMTLILGSLMMACSGPEQHREPLKELEVHQANGRWWISWRGRQPLGKHAGLLVRGKSPYKSQLQYKKGKDSLGSYEAYSETALAGLLDLCIKVYAEQGFMVFEQTFQEDVVQDSAHKSLFSPPKYSFPSFLNSQWDKGLYMHSFEAGIFHYPLFYQGMAFQSPDTGKHGPLLIYDEDFHTLIFSPLSHPLHSSLYIDPADSAIYTGFPEGVPFIPQGTTYRSILVSGKGINATYDKWGQLLQDYHHSKPVEEQADRVLSHLSYWTDAGAAYWYNTPQGKSYWETLQSLKAHHDSIGLPIGLYQLDSWWYERSGGYLASVHRWLPRDTVACRNFNARDAGKQRTRMVPVFEGHSMEEVQDLLGAPLAAHFKHVSVGSPYIEGNSSPHQEEQFDFYTHKYAVPQDYQNARAFFDYLTRNKDWELAHFEHDWLNWIWNDVKPFWDLKVGSAFFRGMNDAMQADSLGWNNVGHRTIQLCMSNASTTLHSVRMPAVTTIRSSIDTDYPDSEGPQRWFWNTFSGRFITTLGKYPFMDNRHSSWLAGQHPEAHAELEFIWSNLHGAPLGLGDTLGNENMTLIQKAILPDGRLLKPSLKARPYDKNYLEHPMTDSSELALGIFAGDSLGKYTYYYSLHMNCNTAGKPTLMAYNLRDYIQTYYPGNEADTRYLVYWFGEECFTQSYYDQPLLDTVERQGMSYQVIAPMMDNEMAFLGCLDKHVPLSHLLFEDLQSHEQGFSVQIKGKTGQKTLYAYSPKGEFKVYLDSEEWRSKHWKYDTEQKLLRIRLPGAAQSQLLEVRRN